MVVDIAEKAAFIYDILGCEEQKNYATNLACKVKNAIRKNLIDCEKKIAIYPTQTAQAMAIYYNIFNEDEKTDAVENLVEIIHNEDDLLNVGVLGGRVLFNVLAEYGYAQLAYNMIVRPEYPSYGYNIINGATTLTERFMRPKTKSPGTESKNHHFWGFVSSWFYRYLAGININPTKSDANDVLITPYFIDEINYICAEHTLTSGLLKVEIEKNDRFVTLNLNYPENVNTVVKAPKGWKLKLLTKMPTNATYTFSKS